MSIKLPTFRTAPDLDQVTKDDPLDEFLVWWLDFCKNDIRKFRNCLSLASREAHLQRFLSANPMLLAHTLGGGHGRWVIPQKRLGCEYVTDFVIGERSSVGFEWYAVELESPKAKMFTKKGDPTQQLTHAIRQITDWRSWLSRNQPYAARFRTEHGLGLTDINPNLPGLILIGRRTDIDESTTERRRQMMSDLRIRIHSYDWLLDSYREMSVLPIRIVKN
jgi:Domain of unknown function (DUF4263)